MPLSQQQHQQLQQQPPPPSQDDLVWVGGGIQARSDQIHRDKWVQHRDDIRREYTRGGLDHVMQWMLRERDFYAKCAVLSFSPFPQLPNLLSLSLSRCLSPPLIPPSITFFFTPENGPQLRSSC